MNKTIVWYGAMPLLGKVDEMTILRLESTSIVSELVSLIRENFLKISMYDFISLVRLLPLSFESQNKEFYKYWQIDWNIIK